MADQLQLRRGTTAENLAFTGAQGEVTIDTDKHAVVVHDGVTPGGFTSASEQALNNSTIFFDDDTGGGSVADAYQLTAKDDTLVPDQYNDGQYFGFVTTNTNTGPSTADFAGLGQKNIKYADGTDPAAGDIDGRVTMIYDATNDWLELQRKATTSQSEFGSSVRQTVLSGPVNASGVASSIIAGTGLQAIASGISSSFPLILSYGNGFQSAGQNDVVVSTESNQVFGGLTDNDVNYLYLDYDAGTQTLTPGSSVIAPEYSYVKPSSPSTGQYWYPLDHRSSGEVWDGSAWQATLRVYIGEATTSGGSVTAVRSYGYQSFGADGDTNKADAAVRQALNAAGLPPLFACRAWANFNGTGAVAIRESGNVSSITDNGVSDYTMNFITAMPDENYALGGMAKLDSSGAFVSSAVALQRVAAATSVSSCRIGAGYPSGGGGTAVVDHVLVSAFVFR